MGVASFSDHQMGVGDVYDWQMGVVWCAGNVQILLGDRGKLQRKSRYVLRNPSK